MDEVMQTRVRSTRARFGSRVAVLLVFALAVLGLASVQRPASADTAPQAGTPATVSADPLPTVQVNGIVWKQARFGNTVYATGRFTTARPAGVALGGAGSVARVNLLAYDITTGKLITTFVHQLTGTGAQGRAIAVSPDGKRLYVGGTFSKVDGQARKNLAAFDLRTGKLLPGFTGTDGKINAVAATNTQVFVGGVFTTAGGKARTRLAAYTSAGTLSTSWVANVTGANVAALLVTPSQGNLIIGGSFSKVNGSTFYSNAAVKLTTGKVVTTWASRSSSFPIRLQPTSGQRADSLGITSLSTDGTSIFLTAFSYVSGARPGSFEGRAAIRPSDGKLLWLNNCAGDTYDAVPIGKVLYSVGHAHNCSPIDGFPQQASWRALAETTYATGVNSTGLGGSYAEYGGQPRGTLLNWFPTLNTANVSGSHQAAWSVVGTSTYVALGGEFTLADGKPQQGLVRYAVRSATPTGTKTASTSVVAPNALGPYRYPLAGVAVTATPADTSGQSTVRTFVTGDPDNEVLTYTVYREGSDTALASRTVTSRYWDATSWTFVDTGLQPGATARYRLVVADPFGNQRAVDQATAVDDASGAITYTGSGWTGATGRANTTPDFARTLHSTSTNGDSATYTFVGTSLKVLAEKGSDGGTVSVRIDGGTATSVSLGATTRSYQQNVFQRTGLARGEHTITLTKTAGAKITLDALVTRP